MSSDRIEITCPRCGHKWWVAISELGRATQTIYRSVEQRPLKEYRVRCPKDSTYVIVQLEEDGHE
jgi:hypothetical protein